MRNVSKRWNAPILCNVLRSCSVAQNCIVSNMAISSGCRNNGIVCDVYLWFTCNYVNGGRFLSERCMFWERCLFWERCMFLERCRFCERCNYNLSVQIFFTFEPVVPPYKRQVFVVLACHQSACVNAQMSEWMIELSKAAERTKKKQINSGWKLLQTRTYCCPFYCNVSLGFWLIILRLKSTQYHTLLLQSKYHWSTVHCGALAHNMMV